MKPEPAKFTVDEVNSCMWGVNCGPGALAGVLDLTLDQVRPHMGDFEKKHYTNIKLMYSALQSLGKKYKKLDKLYPYHGLVRIQWCGPWTEPKVDPRSRLRHTHWIGVHSSAVDEVWIFDINCICVGGWVSQLEWELKVVPWLLPQVEPKASGDWYPTHILELDGKVWAEIPKGGEK